MDIINYFDNYLDITTKDGKTIHIEKKNVYINDSSQFNGNINIIHKRNNIVILREVYSFDDKRLRYSYDEYTNPKIYDTYEKDEDGSEKPITVIESYKERKNKIGSIGDIKSTKTDRDEQEQVKSKKPKILQLLRPKNDKKSDLAAA